MKGEIVKLVKSGQGNDRMWQQAWLNYISMNGNGNSDPAEYDEKFLCDFLNWLVLAGSMEMGGGMQSSSGTSADTSIGKCSKEPMGVGTRDSQKDDLLRKIKSFQRKGAPPEKRKIDTDDRVWSKQNALPKIAGCYIFHRKEKRRKGWQVYYPKHGSKYCGYEKLKWHKVTSREACNSVLHWAWDHHRREQNVECPWDFTPRCE